MENDLLEITPSDAKKVRKDAKVGEELRIDITPSDFGRIAAQTAKQVIIQRIREAEKNMIFQKKILPKLSPKFMWS